MTDNKWSFSLEDEKTTLDTVEELNKIKNECSAIEPINSIDDNDDLESNKKIEHQKERENWLGKFDFFLSALAYAVGLGAVWRFPYLCYKNGGGVFLIPYFFVLFTIGIPLVFLELAVGQFTSTGPLTCWRMAPILRGIGVSMNIVNGYFCIYYNMILAYAIYFLYQLFANITKDVPWAHCNLAKYPNSGCVDDAKNISLMNCDNFDLFLKCPNGRCYDKLTVDKKFATCKLNTSLLNEVGYWKITFPSQDFWSNEILEKTDTINETGYLVWQLVLALFVSWLIVYAMVVKGIKVSGKLVYFTALFPYVVLLILGINGWRLPGAGLGIKFYITPDFSRLKDWTVWTDAAVQIFFTLNVSYGGLVALSSYNKYNTNILRDAIVVSLSNCLTSVFAGFVIFAYIGNLAAHYHKDIKDVIQEGQGLAYVVYPHAVTTIPGTKVWAFLFFCMMLVIGLDTMMASVETLITSIFDIMPRLKKKSWIRYLTITLICFVLFLSGLIFCAQSGTYWVEILDSFSGSWAVLLVATLECLAVGWIYGFDKFKNDISTMIGSKVTDHWSFNVWRITWCYLSPIVLVLVAGFRIYESSQSSSNTRSLPLWSNLIGNIITVSTIFGVIIWAIYALVDAMFINKRPLKTLFKPDSGWKPRKGEHQILVDLAHKRNVQCKDVDNVIGKSNECFNAAAEIEKS